METKQRKNMNGNNSSTQDIVAAQALYIDNLQQQVYYLENEIGYLRAHMEQSNKMQPTMASEAEKMVKTLAESQKEIQTTKVDLKRKQTTIDLVTSEKQRIQRKLNEQESKFYKQKNDLLEEIVTLRKQRDEFLEKCVELERQLEEVVQRENHLQGDHGSLRVQLEEVKKEMSEDKILIESLQQSKKDIQKSFTELQMQLEMKSSTSQEDTVKQLKSEIQEIQELLTTAGKVAEHEKLLRSRLSDDNENLIKRHAEMEAELAEIRAKLREAESIQARLEDSHLKTIVAASEAKTELETQQGQISHLKQRLKVEKERSLQLASQVSDEQRFKVREEQKAIHLQKQLDQKEGKIKIREHENTELLSANTFLKEEVVALKEQVKQQDIEVEELKCKVQDMQVFVEDFVQNSKAANRLEGQRWKQITHFAEGIRALTKEAMGEQDL